MYAASKTLAEQGEGLQHGLTEQWEAELYMLDIQSYGNGITHIKKNWNGISSLYSLRSYSGCAVHSMSLPTRVLNLPSL